VLPLIAYTIGTSHLSSCPLRYIADRVQGAERRNIRGQAANDGRRVSLRVLGLLPARSASHHVQRFVTVDTGDGRDSPQQRDDRDLAGEKKQRLVPLLFVFLLLLFSV